MAKLVLTDITSGYLTATSYNANNALVVAALENTLSRDGTIPNQMSSNLDMNSNDLNNTRFVRTTGIILNGVTVSTAALVAAGIGVETQTATALQTLFTLASVSYLQGVNSLQVYINGVLQPSTDYTETSTTSVTFTTGIPLGDLVTFVVQVTTSIGTADATAISYTPTAGQITDVATRLTGLATMSALLSEKEGGLVTIKGWHTTGDGGGGDFYWDAAANKNTHNGGTIIDPDNTADLATWDAAAKTTWFTTGTGTGCWIRLGDIVKEKFFGSKVDDTEDDVVSTQAFIDYLEIGPSEGFLSKGTSLCTSGLTIDAAIALRGEGDGSKLRFTQTTGSALIIANTASIVGLVLDDFNMEGPSNANVIAPTQTTIGIDIHPSGSFTCTRNLYRRIHLEKFHTPIRTGNSHTNHFDSCLVGSSFWALIANTQTNNNLFTGFQSSNTWLTMDVTTSEGIQFNTPLFQNVSATSGEGAQIQLFQSHVILINPYFENTCIDAIAEVGTNAEAITVRSGLTIIGGELNEGTGSNVIIIGQSGVRIHVDGIRAASTGIRLGVVGSPSTPTRLEWVTNDSVWKPFGDDTTRSVNLIEEMLPNNSKVYAKGGGGGGVLTSIPIREGYRLLQTSVTNRGPIITSGLTSGEWYTVVYAIRKTAGMSISFVNENSGTGTDKWSLAITDVPLTTEDFEYHYFSFKAEDDQLYMNLSLSAVDIEIKYLAVRKGIDLSPLSHGFQPIVFNTVAPASGSWLDGDVCHRQPAAVGSPSGDVCTASGTPGTWTAMANL